MTTLLEDLKIAPRNGRHTRTVPVRIGSHTVYLAIDSSDPASPDNSSAQPSTMQQALYGLDAFTKAIANHLSTSGAAKVSVEFGCTFTIEYGSIVAVIGKPTTDSVLRVTLACNDQTPTDAPTGQHR
jgi:hypothetical protein